MHKQVSFKPFIYRNILWEVQCFMKLYRFPSLLLYVDTWDVHIINVKEHHFGFQSD
jgi:hypothetical protein